MIVLASSSFALTIVYSLQVDLCECLTFKGASLGLGALTLEWNHAKGAFVTGCPDIVPSFTNHR